LKELFLAPNNLFSIQTLNMGTIAALKTRVAL
jgi:hypothetical protein